MRFMSKVRGRPVQVTAAVSKPYPQAPLEVDLQSVLDARGHEVPTTDRDDARLRDQAIALHSLL